MPGFGLEHETELSFELGDGMKIKYFKLALFLRDPELSQV